MESSCSLRELGADDTLYAAGLRLSEARHRQISDIDSKRMQLRIACGKGRKERRVPMSPRLLTALRDDWRESRPPSSRSPTGLEKCRGMDQSASSRLPVCHQFQLVGMWLY